MKNAFLLLLLLSCLSVSAQQRSFKTNSGDDEKRLALVIGNAAYAGNSLTNPVNDARAMRTALQSLGFTVQYYENLAKPQLEAALLRYAAELRRHNVGLFYFAGHGFESKDKINYLMSTDVTSELNEALAKDKSLSLDVVIESMRDANPRTNLLLVDACRNNPFRGWSRDGAKGLAPVNPPLGTVVFFAASPGQQADDNRTGNNGLFTEELLNQLQTPNLELTQILKNTSRAVYLRSGNQVPSLTGTLLDDFYFVRSTSVVENNQLFRKNVEDNRQTANSTSLGETYNTVTKIDEFLQNHFFFNLRYMGDPYEDNEAKGNYQKELVRTCLKKGNEVNFANDIVPAQLIKSGKFPVAFKAESYLNNLGLWYDSYQVEFHSDKARFSSIQFTENDAPYINVYIKKSFNGNSKSKVFPGVTVKNENLLQIKVGFDRYQLPNGKWDSKQLFIKDITKIESFDELSFTTEEWEFKVVSEKK